MRRPRTLNRSIESLEQRLALASVSYVSEDLYPQEPVYSESWIAKLADLNSDGQVDLAAYRYGMLEWLPLLDDGQQVGQPQKTPLSQSPTLLLDFDQDGDLDALNHRRPGIRWNERTRDGFASQPHQIEHLPARLLFVADMDSDSDLDVVAYLTDARVTYWLENEGFNFDRRHLITNTRGETVEALDDFDRDGNVDILMTSFDKMHVLYNEGDGRSWKRESIDSGYAAALGVGDVNADGLPDIVASESNEIVVYINDAGTLSSIGSVATVDHAPREIRIGDFNGDAATDLIFSRGNRSTIHEWLPGLGPLGQFGPQRRVSNNGQGGQLRDMDQDGDLDLLSGFHTWQENVDGELAKQHAITSRLRVADGVLVDLDHDGDVDIVEADNEPGIFWQQDVFWRENDGDSFGPRRSLNTDLLFRVNDGIRPLEMTWHDLNGDSLPDVIYRTGGCAGALINCEIRLQLNVGDGSLTESVVLAKNAVPLAPAKVVELDGDADPDIVMTWQRYEFIEGVWRPARQLAWFEFSGQDPVQWTETILLDDASIPSQMSDLDVDGVDLDGDERQELIVGGEDSFSVYSLVGDDLKLLHTTDEGSYAGHYDFDRDGMIDLVARNRYDLLGMRNLGDGQLSPAIALLFTGTLEEIVLQDMDGDEDVDLLVLEQSLYWYENEGVDWSSASIHTVTTEWDRSLAPPLVADLDSDGDVDVVTLSSAFEQPRWHRNLQTDGDLNLDGATSVADVDPLVQAVLSARADARFDLNRDQQIDHADLEFYLTVISKLAPGDVNGDGVFDSTDLLLVFQAGHYDRIGPKTPLWTGGDWNADGWFESSDLVLAFQRGNYQRESESPRRFTEKTSIDDGIDSLPPVSQAVSVDLNGDQHSDLLLLTTEGVLWVENLGESYRDDFHFLNVMSSSLATGDLDRDGDVDLLTRNDGQLWWHANDGQGLFSTGRSISHAPSTAELQLVDVNGDQWLDVLSYPSLYVNQGDGTFDGRPISTYGTDSVRATDLDSDGDQDLVVGDFRGIRWFPNIDGRGTFYNQPQDIYLDARVDYLTAADIDQDGDADIVTSSDRNGVSVLINQGANQFEVGTLQASGEPMLTDVDDDGNVDLILESSGEFRWFEWSPLDAEFQLRQEVVKAMWSSHIVPVSRADGAGQDLVLLSENLFNRMELNVENQQFDEETPLRQTSTLQQVLAADVDGDGIKDVVTLYAGSDQLSWRRNLGEGRFGADTPIGSGKIERLIALDQDGDSAAEFVGISRDPTGIVLFKSPDRGQHWNVDVIASPNEEYRTLRTIAVGDVDGDGRIDLVTSWDVRKVWWSPLPSGPNEQIEPRPILEPLGDGNTAYYYLDVHDVDSDGDADLVFASFWMQHVDGQWVYGGQLLDANFGRTVKTYVADLDNDADADYVHFSRGIARGENVSELGVIVGPVDVEESPRTGPESDLGFVTDIDQDGDDDILAVWLRPGRTVWYANRGDGTFTLPEPIEERFGRWLIDVGDLNGDGLLDVLVGSTNHNSVDVFWNQPQE